MITLRQYLEETNKVIKEHPEYLDLPLVYSRDNVGNGFYQLINDEISSCYSENIHKGQFDYDEIEFDCDTPNLICIN